MIENIEPLGPNHDRGAFSCGIHDIDSYLLAFDFEVKAPSNRIYVAIDNSKRILGYYSLRPAIWEVRDKYNKIVSASFELELAMIGVVKELQGKKSIGMPLLLDAFKKTLAVSNTVGGIERLWVGPLNDRCKKFYKNAAFTKAGNSQRMFIAVGEIADALAELDTFTTSNSL